MNRIFILLFSFMTFSAFANTGTPSDMQDSKMNLDFNQGVVMSHEPSHFKMKTRFRLQNRFTLEGEHEDREQVKSSEFLIRRARLRFEGTVLDPGLFYRIQLSFTRQDQDWDNTGVPNILRDAVVGYSFNKQHQVFLGVTKLPGNRQRVVSSGALQFVDRSILNATLNVDRDQGVQGRHTFGQSAPLEVSWAFTNGEGRGTTNSDSGMSYTSRLEWYPLGEFKDGGNYYEGDLVREESPKLALAVSANNNRRTNRTGGQIGQAFTTGETRTLETLFADGLLKYHGWAFSFEAAKRNSRAPLVSSTRTVFVGKSLNVQASKIFENNMEYALRYSKLDAENIISSKVNDQRQFALGISKYINKHAVKVQGDLTFNELTNPSTPLYQSNWIARVQVELGI